MRGPSWKTHEDVKLTIMYCGGVLWKRIDELMEGRSRMACSMRVTKLKIPRKRHVELRTANYSDKEKLLWDIYGLRVKGYNKREISAKLKIPFGATADLMYTHGLHLHPPKGTPP